MKMKRFLALMATLAVAASLLAMPAAAELTEFKWTVHNSPNKHENLMVMETTVGVVIENKRVEREHMTAAQMKDVVEAVLEYEEQTLIPEDMQEKIKLENIVALEDRLISCPEAPFVARFRVWGTGERPVFVFWKAVDDTEWTLVLCQQGTDVMPEFPGDGLYAVGRA